MRTGIFTFAVLMYAMRLSTDVAAGQENISSLAPLAGEDRAGDVECGEWCAGYEFGF